MKVESYTHKIEREYDIDPRSGQWIRMHAFNPRIELEIPKLDASDCVALKINGRWFKPCDEWEKTQHEEAFQS